MQGMNTNATSGDSPLAIILAAGKGTRMESELPKVLVPVCGRPMVRYVVEAVQKAGISRIVVVVGYRADLVRGELQAVPQVQYAEQLEQLGTGHAVMMCREQLAARQGPVLVVAGDSPLLQPHSVQKLVETYHADQCACVIGTVEKPDPTGYGRIVRDSDGRFLRVVEQKDASPAEKEIREVNVSTYVFDSQQLLLALQKLTDENAQQEYYLTDCPAIMMQAGQRVVANKVLQPCEALSINNLEELADVEQEMQRLAGS